MMAGKPAAGRGRRFSAAELEAARRVRLPDVIADDLVVLFCGANPGLSSAAARAPFATPGDRWWPALYESGFTPRRLAPREAHELLALGLGLTSLVRRPTVGVAELARAEFVEGGRLLRRRVLTRRPRWLAVLGVTAYRAAFGRPDAAVGLQEDTIGSTRLWILPNPSGLNAHYPPRALATEFARLRVAAGLPDRSRRLEDATLCRLPGRACKRLCFSVAFVAHAAAWGASTLAAKARASGWACRATATWPAGPCHWTRRGRRRGAVCLQVT
jgi:double-stranded uracil-DNA glycosylase